LPQRRRKRERKHDEDARSSFSLWFVFAFFNLKEGGEGDLFLQFKELKAIENNIFEMALG
jgi:hypothetical protein